MTKFILYNYIRNIQLTVKGYFLFFKKNISTTPNYNSENEEQGKFTDSTNQYLNTYK